MRTTKDNKVIPRAAHINRVAGKKYTTRRKKEKCSSTASDQNLQGHYFVNLQMYLEYFANISNTISDG